MRNAAVLSAADIGGEPVLQRAAAQLFTVLAGTEKVLAGVTAATVQRPVN